ncbi:MAG: PIN domain-containing protein [Thermomicrobiales bacterium]|nr:PIN domain-containing protein [Thermomicrobiales bacterium]
MCDSNVWLALTVDSHSHHNVASAWFDSISEPGSVHFCRATQQSFLRLITMASVMRLYELAPRSNQQAWSSFNALLRDDRISFQMREPAGLEVLWERFSGRNSASPKLWMDAYLAAFARAGGYQMVTTDAAFSQFQGLDLLVLSSPSD